MIAAVILAAGESKRMGQPKMLLAWGAETVLEHVISTVHSAGVPEVIVVTGAARTEIEAICRKQKVTAVFNPAFSQNELLGSLQYGLRALGASIEAALVTLGDQPQIQADSVQAVLGAYAESKAPLVVPSYGRRRGHPWLLVRSLWEELLDLAAPESPREFLNRHSSQIRYVEIDSPSILQDLDTPDDYRQAHPQGSPTATSTRQSNL
jgi:molybdenum cofactor cytidylyltransferase